MFLLLTRYHYWSDNIIYTYIHACAACVYTCKYIYIIYMYTYVCIWIYVSTYVIIMILALCASSGGMGFIHVSHMFCIALCVCGDVCEFTWHKTITKTITKLTRKPSSNTMAHWSPCHGGSPQRGKPHPQLCWRQPQRWRQPANLKTLKKRSSSKHVVATCGYGEFAPRSVFAAKVWMPEVNGSWTNDFLDGLQRQYSSKL